MVLFSSKESKCMLRYIRGDFHIGFQSIQNMHRFQSHVVQLMFNVLRITVCLTHELKITIIAILLYKRCKAFSCIYNIFIILC